MNDNMDWQEWRTDADAKEIGDSRYLSEAMPMWVCPACGKFGGTAIIDPEPPVCGMIAVECHHCGEIEM